MSVTGIDATKGLVDIARQLGGGSFHVLEYEKLSKTTLNVKVDVAVCNFSLLGKESVDHIFKVIPTSIKEGGHFIIQTLHPHVNCGDAPYIDAWRTGSWEGFSKDFVDPAPWFFRTLETWIDMFISEAGLELIQVKEPINPLTGKAASLLLVGRVTT